MTQAAPHRPLAEPFSTGASWLARAVAVSIVLHVIAAVAWWLGARPADNDKVELVDIELAPPPPPVEALPEEVAKAPEEALAAAAAAQESASAAEPDEPGEDDTALVDAGVDAGVDAPVDAMIDAPPEKKTPDAGIDAEAPLVAEAEDGGVGDAGDPDAGAGQVAMIDPGTTGSNADGAGSAAASEGAGSAGARAASEGTGTGSGSAGPGVAGATEAGSSAGLAGMDNQPAVEGAPTSAGTAANLLAYFPPGHQITVLVRFDRLRKTEWAAPATELFKPMPDYGALFGARNVAIADRLDTLVISSPRPRDATATTLVARTPMSRTEMRDFLANPAAPIEWSATKGGMFGKRTRTPFPNDRRVLLSPWRGWFVLAQPEDLAGLTTGASKATLDMVEAKAKLPPWLASIREIEKETTDAPATPTPPPRKPSAASTSKPGASPTQRTPRSSDDARGPALVLTLKGPGKRYKIPDVGLGVTSAPSPDRLSLAMELVKQGWLVRGNIVFASEADATEFVQTVRDAQTRVTDSRILSAVLKKQHVLNAITGLSLARSGARVSYATSVSIADARELLAVAAQTLDAYFANPP